MSDKNDKSTNIVVKPPDYGSIIQNQALSSVVSTTIDYLLKANIFKSKKHVARVLGNLVLIFVVHSIFMEYKHIIDGFKFSNFITLQYLWQKLRTKKTYEFIFIKNEDVGDKSSGDKSTAIDKWQYVLEKDKLTSLNTKKYQPLIKANMLQFFNKLNINIDQQTENNYINYFGTIINIKVSNKMVTIYVSNIGNGYSKLKDEVESWYEKNNTNNVLFLKFIFTGASSMPKTTSLDASYVFKTNIYEKIAHIIEGRITISDKLNLPRLPQLFIFNGPPGTGKTTTGNYLAQCNLVDLLMIMPMFQPNNITRTITDILNSLAKEVTRQLDEKIKIIEKSANTNIKRPVVCIFLDEFDKWLHEHISKSLDAHVLDIAKSKKEAEMSVEKSNDKSDKSDKSEKKSPPKEVIISPDELAGLRETHRLYINKKIKTEIFLHLHSMADGNLFDIRLNVLIMFNTNNYEYIFEDVDAETLKHVDALRTRMPIFTFEEIGKDEIVKLMKDIKRKLEDETEVNYDDIADDIKISYRQIMTLLTTLHFDFNKFIYSINNIKIENNKHVEINQDVAVAKNTLEKNTPKLPALVISNNTPMENININIKSAEIKPDIKPDIKPAEIKPDIKPDIKPTEIKNAESVEPKSEEIKSEEIKIIKAIEIPEATLTVNSVVVTPVEVTTTEVTTTEVTTTEVTTSMSNDSLIITPADSPVSKSPELKMQKSAETTHNSETNDVINSAILTLNKETVVENTK